MSFFVTGTDTGIGKTVVSTTLAVGLCAKYWKPVQTGIERDSDFVAQWIGGNRVHPEAYCLPEPASPHLAAEALGVELDIKAIAKSRPDGLAIVEGAGGVLVPLNDRDLMVDLMRELNLPVVVATSTRLGTINHTLLTVQALQLRQIPIRGIITVGEDNPATRSTLIRWTAVAYLGHVPKAQNFSLEWFQESFARLGLAQSEEASCSTNC